MLNIQTFPYFKGKVKIRIDSLHFLFGIFKGKKTIFSKVEIGLTLTSKHILYGCFFLRFRQKKSAKGHAKIPQGF